MSYAGCFARRCVEYETRRERFGDMENGRSFHSNCIMTIVNRLALRVLSIICTLLIRSAAPRESPPHFAGWSGPAHLVSTSRPLSHSPP